MRVICVSEFIDWTMYSPAFVPVVIVNLEPTFTLLSLNLAPVEVITAEPAV